MKILKRPEIWVLALIAVAAAIFALRPPPAELVSETPAGTPASKLSIESLTLTRDHGNARLDITFTYDNRGGAEIIMAKPDVVLSAGGSEVPPFFLVGSFPDPLPADRRARNTVKYWLEPDHFSQPITFVVRGESTVLKSADPFDLTTLDSGEARTINPGNW